MSQRGTAEGKREKCAALADRLRGLCARVNCALTCCAFARQCWSYVKRATSSLCVVSLCACERVSGECSAPRQRCSRARRRFGTGVGRASRSQKGARRDQPQRDSEGEIARQWMRISERHGRYDGRTECRHRSTGRELDSRSFSAPSQSLRCRSSHLTAPRADN